jgi:hypothetical protein
MTAPLLLGAISAVIPLQVAIGIGLGFWQLRHLGPAPLLADRVALATTTGAWAGWREFRVDSDLPASAAEPKRTIVRCCSLSDQPNGETYRITIKRIAAPVTQPDLPAGAASDFLHDAVQAGDVLKVKAPADLLPCATERGHPGELHVVPYDERSAAIHLLWLP